MTTHVALKIIASTTHHGQRVGAFPMHVPFSPCTTRWQLKQYSRCYHACQCILDASPSDRPPDGFFSQCCGIHRRTKNRFNEEDESHAAQHEYAKQESNAEPPAAEIVKITGSKSLLLPCATGSESLLLPCPTGCSILCSYGCDISPHAATSSIVHRVL